MKFVWLWTVLWNILPLSSTAQKYITINVTDKDGLAITCSIINSDQLAKTHLIQLHRKKNKTFETVISINPKGIVWKDEALKNRTTANGSLEEEELRLFIKKVQCFTDFTEYRCYMEGILNPTSTQKNPPEINDTVTWSYSDTCTYKDKRSSGTTLHISITGVETSQYTALLNALFWIPVWIIVKLNTDSA
eukprot:XP_019919121.1 PREDICTED: uncharacterized protein LOC105319393 isoform X2 [Crassostrea gigas]